MVETLIERIARHEGFSSYVYLDSQGYLSLGYGTTVGRVGFMPGDSPRALVFHKQGVGLTRAQAQRLLEDRIKQIRHELEKKIIRLGDLSLVRRGVLLEMAYQLGVAGVLKFKRMWAALAKQDYETAAIEMLDSRWAQQTPERAKELAGIMRAWSDHNSITDDELAEMKELLSGHAPTWPPSLKRAAALNRCIDEIKLLRADNEHLEREYDALKAGIQPSITPPPGHHHWPGRSGTYSDFQIARGQATTATPAEE